MTTRDNDQGLVAHEPTGVLRAASSKHLGIMWTVCIAHIMCINHTMWDIRSVKLAYGIRSCVMLVEHF